jgi:hypothetical protein
MLYNSMLRGFGNCGEVPASEDVELGSPEFWKLLGQKTVADRMKKAGHKFSSTMHALASGVKKIQGIAEEGQGTRLYRGLGKLLTQLFTALNLCSSLIINNNHWQMFLIIFFSSLLLCLIRWAGRSAVHYELRLYRDGIHVFDPRTKCRA